MPIRLDPNRLIYDFYSCFYDRIFGSVFQKSREKVIKGLNFSDAERVLEVGVGTGLCLPLYPSSIRLTGIDISPNMLSVARGRIIRDGLTPSNLIEMDAGRMGFVDDHFDTVIAAYVVTAVTDHHQVMREIVRVTRPGGRILLLNHFLQDSGLVATAERAISPVCRRLGFRTDLSVEDIVGPWPLLIQSEARMPPLRMWRFLECLNEKPANAPSNPHRSSDPIHDEAPSPTGYRDP